MRELAEEGRPPAYLGERALARLRARRRRLRLAMASLATATCAVAGAFVVPTLAGRDAVADNPGITTSSPDRVAPSPTGRRSPATRTVRMSLVCFTSVDRDASGREARRLWVFQPATGRYSPLPYMDCLPSPDGRYVLLLGPAAGVPAPPADVQSPRVSQRADSVLDLQTGEQRRLDLPAHVANPRWSRDGKKIISTADEGGRAVFYVTDARTATSEPVVTGFPASVLGFAFGPQGEILFQDNSRTLHTLDASGRSYEHRQVDWLLPDCSWSPDGKYLAYPDLTWGVGWLTVGEHNGPVVQSKIDRSKDFGGWVDERHILIAQARDGRVVTYATSVVTGNTSQHRYELEPADVARLAQLPVGWIDAPRFSRISLRGAPSVAPDLAP